MRPLRAVLTGAAVLTLGAGTVAFAGSTDRGERDRDRHRDAGPGWRHGNVAAARLIDANGDRVGTVTFKQRRDGPVRVSARVRDLPPGFHGFHVHTVGACDPPAFTSAGGHFNPTGATHRDHAGDLPVLLVQADGRATLATATDRFALDDLRDRDGSAVMVHALADNYANIPARYGGPDAETLNTGDSGGRIACGVVR
jgi:Cu-Zn family superoxide dismutase